jgi:hypothetical protein
MQRKMMFFFAFLLFFSTFVGVKTNQHTIVTILLGMLMTVMPGICLGIEAPDSLMSTDSLTAQDNEAAQTSELLNKVWNFHKKNTHLEDGIEQNVYFRYNFTTERRNPTLFVIPSMYAIARGDKQYVGEAYGKMKYRDVGEFDMTRQVVCGTIPHNQTVMATMQHYLTPALYDVALYKDHLLSPFHRQNRFYYSYRVTMTDSTTAIITFRPHLRNTQLVRGLAMADINTGRLKFVSFSANFDMISVTVTVEIGDDSQSILPKRCLTDGKFRFVGNKINASIVADFNCNTSLPDSINDRDDRDMMATLRPMPLRKNEMDIYQHYDETHKPDTTQVDETSDTLQHKRRVDEIVWDFIDDNIFSSLEANAGPASVRMSPLINPQYLSYSKSKGVSYRLNIGARYAWNTHRYLSLNPQLGYNFKQRLFYFTAPLRMTYNPKRNGYAELTWANGNRINSGALVDMIKQRMGSDYEVPEFKDRYVQAINNIQVFDWLEISSGVVYHVRKSTNRLLMRELNLPEEYSSFAPLMTVHLSPWTNGPMLTANYEWGLKGVLGTNLSYARWEFDAAYKRKLRSLRQMNFRVGTGFYTTRNTDFFIDFTNFRDNNLPTGWDDEWAGQFQMLDSRLYNESNYYVRGHFSYDSPLLMLSWMPLLGRAIEKERIYVSVLSIEHTRPYYEIGYGFTNRMFSAAVFGAVLGRKFQEIGCKFTLELFKRW